MYNIREEADNHRSGADLNAIRNEQTRIIST